MLTNIPPVLVAPNSTLSPVLSNPKSKLFLLEFIMAVLAVLLNLSEPVLIPNVSTILLISFPLNTGLENLVLLQVNCAVPLATSPVVCVGKFAALASNVPVPVIAYTLSP